MFVRQKDQKGSGTFFINDSAFDPHIHEAVSEDEGYHLKMRREASLRGETYDMPAEFAPDPTPTAEPEPAPEPEPTPEPEPEPEILQ